jgi:hypothetical protein
MVDFDVVTGPAPPLRLPAREAPPTRERPRAGGENTAPNAGQRPAGPAARDNPLPIGETGEREG